MKVFALLVALGPIIGWGLFPTISSKLGGRPTNQILGATLGALISSIFLVIFGLSHVPTNLNFALGILSGLGWGFGQIMAFRGYALVGSSRVMPITTAFQLVVTALWGVFALGNWAGLGAKVIGGIALIVIIIGAALTVWSPKDKTSNSTAGALRTAIILQAIGVVGYWLYSAAPQAAPALHLPKASGMDYFFPQALGMVIMAVIYCLYELRENQGNALLQKVSYIQIISGLFFAFGALTYLISAEPEMNGLATAFVISQVSVVVATLTGIYWLGQHKTKKEMVLTLIGLGMILVAATVTAFL